MCHFLPKQYLAPVGYEWSASLSVLVTMILWRTFFFPYTTETGTLSSNIHALYSKWIQKKKNNNKNQTHIVVKSDSLQGAPGKLFIKKTCPVKYAVVLTILTIHFKMGGGHFRLQ